MVLIEKEFVSFGHHITSRSGHASGERVQVDTESSPVLLQFLDCVHQIMYQRSQAFEFTE